MHSNLLLQLRCRAPHNTTRDQSLGLLYPGKNKGLHALIFLHLSLCLFPKETKGKGKMREEKEKCKGKQIKVHENHLQSND